MCIGICVFLCVFMIRKYITFTMSVQILQNLAEIIKLFSWNLVYQNIYSIWYYEHYKYRNNSLENSVRNKSGGFCDFCHIKISSVSNLYLWQNLCYKDYSYFLLFFRWRL